MKARHLADWDAGSITCMDGFAPKGKDRNKGGGKVSQKAKWFLNDTSEQVIKGRQTAVKTAAVKQSGDMQFQRTRVPEQGPETCLECEGQTERNLG